MFPRDVTKTPSSVAPIVLLVALVTTCAWLPGSTAGFMADDHFFVFSLGTLPAEHPLHNLFGLVNSGEEVRVFRDRGVLPWWASDDMRIVFWRPLPSLTHWVDWRVFGQNPVAMHLVSIGWYLLVIALAWRVYARFFPARSPWLLLAVVVFALDDAHVLNVQWIASRNDLVAASALLAALLGVLRLREGGSRANCALIFGGFAAGLLSKESSVLFPVLVLAHVVFIPQSDGARLGARLRRHAGLLAGLFAMVTVYLFAYFSAGLGPNTLFYINPIRSPESWASHLLRTGAAHASILATGVPLNTLAPSPWDTIPALAALCALITVAIAALAWRTQRGDPASRFFAIWVLGGLAIVTTGFPDPRLLFLPSIGFAFLIARLAQALWAARSTWAFRGVLALHLVLAPLVTQISLGVVGTLSGRYDQLADACRAAVDYEHLPEGGTEIFFLNWHQREVSPLATIWLLQHLPTGSEPSGAFRAPGVPYTERVDNAFAGMKVGYHPMSFLSAVDLEVIDAHTLRLSAPEGDFFPTMFEQLYFTKGPPAVGERFRLPAFTATIDRVAGDGRVTAARFTFPEPLASPRYRFLTSRAGAWSEVRFGELSAIDLVRLSRHD